MLKCPKCGDVLNKEGNRYCCKKEHSYDISKRGYCNLLLGNQKSTGDDKGMVRARTMFLSRGYYQKLSDRIIELLKKLQVTIVVDAGCGEGYYTNQIKSNLPNIQLYGFDLSKVAIDEASRSKNGVFYGVCNVFQMPLENECVDAIVSVFAPVNEDENARLLKEGGYFIKVGPGPKHLLDMKKIVYENVYENEEKLMKHIEFKLLEHEVLDYDITVDNEEDIQALFQMTPYYWKSPKEGSDALHALHSLHTKVQFSIELYQKVAYDKL